MPKQVEDTAIERVIAAELETRELRGALQRANMSLARSKRKSDDLREALQQAATDAILAQGKLKPVPTPRGKSRTGAHGKEEIALLHATDWQASKITSSYNSNVLTERIERLMQKVGTLTDIQRADHNVNKLHIMFGGDMIEGLFNYPAQLWQIDADLFTQWTETSEKVANLVRWGLANFEEVEVTAEWGNHGRIGSKRAEVVKSDNFDRMVYEHARKQLEAETRLKWDDCPDDVQQVEVGNYRALLIHGDEIGRNGFASPTTIVNHANRWRSGAWPWKFRDLYLGHFHTHNEWAMANGEGAVFQTGSTESDNRYARDGMASSAIPSQRLHFIDPDKGRVTSQYKIVLEDDRAV